MSPSLGIRFVISRGSTWSAAQILCAVAELLGRGDHVDDLVQDLARFFLGESVLAHGEQDLHSH